MAADLLAIRWIPDSLVLIKVELPIHRVRVDRSIGFRWRIIGCDRTDAPGYRPPRVLTGYLSACAERAESKARPRRSGRAWRAAPRSGSRRRRRRSPARGQPILITTNSPQTTAIALTGSPHRPSEKYGLAG